MLRFGMVALMAMVGTTAREMMFSRGDTGGSGPSPEREENRRKRPVRE